MSLGRILLGFGLMRFFPGMSPAEGLVVRTLDVLTVGMIPASMSVMLVAALECAIGVGLITGGFLHLALVLLGLQMLGAMSPLLLVPGKNSSVALSAHLRWKPNTYSRTWSC